MEEQARARRVIIHETLAELEDTLVSLHRVQALLRRVLQADLEEERAAVKEEAS